jgi:beta-ureidopropionase / N-carbamoyl-L-amino-acid hydrolase
MVGSGVFASVFDLANGRPDNLTGITLGAELERIGFAGPEPVGGRTVAAYFEAHIEQGPILKTAGLPIGVVSGAQGQSLVRGHRDRSRGSCQADADAAAARRAGRCSAHDRLGQPHRPGACALCLRDGRLYAGQPNSRNTISGRVFSTVDFRHPRTKCWA